MSLFAEVVFPLPLSQSFLYAVPPALAGAAKPGSRIRAPLGSKIHLGFIVRLLEESPSQIVQLKEILEVIDDIPTISEEILSFTEKLSSFYFSSWGEFLAASLPPSAAVRTATKTTLTDKGRELFKAGKLSRDEGKVAGFLQKKPYSLVFLRKMAGPKNMSQLAARMEKKGLIRVERESKALRPKTEARMTPGPAQLELDFSADRSAERAASEILRAMGRGEFAPFYVFGRPAGRQAVYLRLLQQAMDRSKKALYLVPELSLAGPLQAVLEKKLSIRAVFVHGGLSDRAREAAWQRIKGHDADAVAGLRSALFSPADGLGLVIVDDEHDDSYLQLESPAYDARRGAWLRAAGAKAVLVYGSSTPSIEGFYHAQKEGYLLSLDDDGQARQAVVVDDHAEKGLISQKLKSGLHERLASGKPSVVFLNRRGYASFLFCPSCGYVPKCDRCHISLAYHKKEERLVCHYCRDSRPRISACPQCGSKVLEPKGVGVEAVEEELRRLFPQARIACFDSDRVRGRIVRERTLQKFRERKLDILVGTQLLAHQSGLSPVSLVGILNPEALLAFSDFRAAERTFLALSFMMRLADTGDGASQVLIQTAFPDHHSIREAARRDYRAFFQEEIRFRRLMNDPPFSALAEVSLFGRELRSLAEKAREFSGCVKLCSPDIEVLGPAFAPGALASGERRIQVILRTQKPELLDGALRSCLGGIKVKKTVLRDS